MPLMPKIQPRTDAQRAGEIERDLIRYEAKVGSQLFGKVPKGRRRQFFCMDEHTWIWYEEWRDKRGRRQSVTTRYEIRPSGIIKIQDGKTYEGVSKAEADHLHQATELYRKKVGAEYMRVMQSL